MKHIQFQVLLNQLREFGLNPNHWEIKDQGSKFQLSHCENKDLNLMGKVTYQDQKPRWFDLQLMSF